MFFYRYAAFVNEPGSRHNRSRSSWLIAVKLRNSYGNSFSRLLSARYNKVRLVRNPISDGNSVSLLKERYNLIRLVRNPISAI
jgi:hypothetical protein